MAKKEKAQHPIMKEVQVLDIHGYEFTVYSTTEGPIKVESSHLSHPVYNPDKVQKKVSLGRSQLMAEKMAKMASMQKTA
jgi:ribosomal protein L31